MGARVVEGTGLENRQTGNGFVGSNPTPSTNLLTHCVDFIELKLTQWA